MKIKLAETRKAKPDFNNLGFGKFFTDHMLVMNYSNGKWDDPEIVPYEELKLDPCTNILHYGQGIFEGVKAYKNEEGKITTFRLNDNLDRMNRSAARLCMPQFDTKVVFDAILELIRIEEDWIPTAKGTSLYIRPTMIANDKALGVHAAKNYIFFVILSPVGNYYAHGLTPTKIMIEEKYARSCVGGTGECKCMGNYAASILAGEIANQKGYDQVLWLDGNYMKYVEEVGSMNIFFVINNVVVTPMLDGNILDGITRRSTIAVLKDAGYKVEERHIEIKELVDAYNNGTFNECFGTGTAAVISPVGVLHYNGIDMIINDNKMGPVAQYAYDTITGIQTGKVEDKFNWVINVK